MKGEFEFAVSAYDVALDSDRVDSDAPMSTMMIYITGTKVKMLQ